MYCREAWGGWTTAAHECFIYLGNAERIQSVKEKPIKVTYLPGPAIGTNIHSTNHPGEERANGGATAPVGYKQRTLWFFKKMHQQSFAKILFSTEDLWICWTNSMLHVKFPHHFMKAQTWFQIFTTWLPCPKMFTLMVLLQYLQKIWKDTAISQIQHSELHSK